MMSCIKESLSWVDGHNLQALAGIIHRVYRLVLAIAASFAISTYVDSAASL